MRITPFRFSAVLVVAVCAFGASVSGAAAQDIASNFIQRMFGLKDDSPQINYSERAPLVIPPKRDLRAPQGSVADADPAWPKDPDEQKRLKAGEGLVVGPRAGEGNKFMTEEERLAGTTSGAPADTGGRTPAEQQFDFDHWSKPVGPTKLTHKGTFGYQAPPLVAGVEPPRRSLIDPPKGTRVPSASAPLSGDEPLPSDGDGVPWYKKLTLFGN